MKALGSLVFGIAALVYRAWLASIAWSWVAVAMYGFPEIGVAAMIAVQCVFSLAFSTMHQHDEREEAVRNIGLVVCPAIVFAILWVALKFV